MKFKKGDEVKIQKGKDSGKTGKIEKIFSKEDKVLVAGINQFKRHVKARVPGQKSQIITITKPLPAGNISIVCAKCKKPTRIGYKFLKDQKVRICKKCKEEIAESKK